MSNQQEDRATVTLPVDSWRAVQAILLREALRLEGAGEVEDATEIVTCLVPVIDGAVDSPILSAPWGEIWGGMMGPGVDPDGGAVAWIG